MRHLILIGLLLPVAAWGVACPTGFTSTTTVTAPTITGTLTNFPYVLTAASNTTLRTTGNGGVVQNSSGFDIVFCVGGNQVSWEQRSWSATTGAAIYVVQVPSLVTGTVITVEAGKSGISSFQGGATGAAYDTDYVSVYALGESGGPYADSTSNANTGTTTNAPTQVSGNWGFAQSFNGSSNLITTGNALSGGANGTLSGLMKYNGASGDALVIETRNGGGQGCNLYGNSGGAATSLCSGGFGVAGATGLGDGVTWHHYAATMQNGVAFTLYVDGVNVSSSSFSGFAGWSGGNWLFGKIYSGAFQASTVHEVRVSNTFKSAAWVSAESANELTPGAIAFSGGSTPIKHRAIGGN
jgi:hypothetical protein